MARSATATEPRPEAHQQASRHEPQQRAASNGRTRWREARQQQPAEQQAEHEPPGEPEGPQQPAQQAADRIAHARGTPHACMSQRSAHADQNTTQELSENVVPPSMRGARMARRSHGRNFTTAIVYKSA